MNLNQLQHLFTLKICSDSKIYNLRSLQVLPVSYIYNFLLSYLFKKFIILVLWYGDMDKET